VLLVDCLFENDGRFHTTECKMKGGCASVFDIHPCNSKLSVPLTFNITQGQTIHLHTCPANVIDADHFELVSLYSHYKSGLFLDDGGLRDQLAYYLFAMRIIAAEVSKIEERMMERSKRKGRR